MNVASLAVRALSAGARLPWIVLFAVVHGVGRGVRSLRLLIKFWRAGDHLVCPVGHANPLHGRWKCGCGFELLGHAFAECPSCGEEAGWFPCRTCGLGIQDPLQR